MERLNSPVVAANIDARQEPAIEKLFNKSTIIYRNNKKIGVIGVVLSTITVCDITYANKFFFYLLTGTC